MTNIRKGDTVLIRATVTDVAKYDDGQQLMVSFGPKADSNFGWMVPGEYDFQLDKPHIRVGDRVFLGDGLLGTVEAATTAQGCNPAYAWVKPDGRSDFRTHRVDELRRV